MVIMNFPLRGEWLAPNTPGSRVPSHGTDRFGARYAYDFIQVDWTRRGLSAYRGSLMRYLLKGMELTRYYCWGAPVFAPCDGIVVRAEDGWHENARTNLLRDVRTAYNSAHRFDPRRDDVRQIAGNYVIIQNTEGVFAALCHCQEGSVAVAPGQHVVSGEYLGRIGNSGNSYMPHLHFQVMDGVDITSAKGIPCVFSMYEVWKDGRWETVKNTMPKNRERIRCI